MTNLNHRYFKNLLYLTLVLFSVTAVAQQMTLTGTITDPEGNPIEGANIFVLETAKGSSSNAEGIYRIEGLKERSYFLQISYLGFQTITKTVNTATTTEIDFVLSQVSDQLGEVVVSANRRLQDIQKTAASVSAIGIKQVEQLQVKQISELSSIAPNFRTYDDGGPGSFTLVASRGISTPDFIPTIGLYVDEVPYFNTLAFPLSFSDIEQIEILRGPQGTLYGRNALGGVIKITSKRPTNDLNGFATVGFGNLDSREIGFGLNTPIVKDKLFFRGNANITERDGFVRNLFNGRDLQDRDALDANFRLKFFANDDLNMSLLYTILRRRSEAYAFVVPSPGNSLQDVLENNPYTVNFNEDVFRRSLTQNLAYNLKYDFGSFALNAVTAYQITDQERLDEFEYTVLDAQSFATDWKLENVTQELRFSSSTDSRLQWTAGTFLFLLNREEATQVDIGVDATPLLPPEFAPLVPYSQIDNTDFERRGIALFGQASYELSDKLTVTAGFRYDNEEVTADVNRVFTAPELPDGSFMESTSFDAISPKLALGYQANPDVFVFVNAARGFRPGTVNTFVLDPANAPVDPENTWNFEAGVKTNLFENRLKLNLTGFFIDYTNQQVFTVINLETFNVGTDNIGESISFGVELESQWAATKNLSFNLNLGYLNTEIRDYEFRDPGTGEPGDFSGNDLIFAPEFNGNLNVNYIQPLNDKINIEATADYNYQSDIFFDFGNLFMQEAYGLLNGRLGVTSRNLDVFVWGKNLTDEVYYSYGFGAGSFASASFALPRTYGVSLTGKF
ncbi:MAG: TonB-dependent receptor [Bacteroidota bacterium]